MALAREAGFRYTNFTTQHHDGFALFESHYPTAFTSHQTHNRDFVREYVDAARKAGMHIGLYKTLINWRYPGYYDVTGTDCQPNKFGYRTEAWHKENARIMKEELYCQVQELMSNYGKIDQLFWDGGWLAQKGSDADGAFFWEPGKYLDPNNSWPVNPLFQLKDSLTGQPLGLMGMVRQLQPDIVCNLRSGWCGDYTCEEGGADVKGPIRNGIVEKCMTITPAWGYTTASEDPAHITPLSRIQRICADCMIRGMCFLINVGPDRHGRIPEPVAHRLREFGQWTRTHAPAIYGTLGGPWQPVDGQYGFTWQGKKLFIWFLGGYTDPHFTLPPLPQGIKVRRAYTLEGMHPIKFNQKRQTVSLYNVSPSSQKITVVAIDLNKALP